MGAGFRGLAGGLGRRIEKPDELVEIAGEPPHRPLEQSNRRFGTLVQEFRERPVEEHLELVGLLRCGRGSEAEPAQLGGSGVGRLWRVGAQLRWRTRGMSPRR